MYAWIEKAQFILYGGSLMGLIILAILLVNGAMANTADINDKETIEYTITKNDKFKVLDAVIIQVPRKIASTYWLLCIDGYKFVSMTQNSGADLVQMLDTDNRPMTCSMN